jgi:hypothetical protein
MFNVQIKKAALVFYFTNLKYILVCILLNGQLTLGPNISAEFDVCNLIQIA